VLSIWYIFFGRVSGNFWANQWGKSACQENIYTVSKGMGRAAVFGRFRPLLDHLASFIPPGAGAGKKMCKRKAGGYYGSGREEQWSELEFDITTGCPKLRAKRATAERSRKAVVTPRRVSVLRPPLTRSIHLRLVGGAVFDQISRTTSVLHRAGVSVSKKRALFDLPRSRKAGVYALKPKPYTLHPARNGFLRGRQAARGGDQGAAVAGCAVTSAEDRHGRAGVRASAAATVRRDRGPRLALRHGRDGALRRHRPLGVQAGNARPHLHPAQPIPNPSPYPPRPEP